VASLVAHGQVILRIAVDATDMKSFGHGNVERGYVFELEVSLVEQDVKCVERDVSTLTAVREEKIEFAVAVEIALH